MGVENNCAQAIKGVCFFHSETGTEGGFWAVQDNKYIFPTWRDWPSEKWSYEGLHILETGDRLTIYDKDDSAKILWSGLISLREYELFKESVYNCWIHADQEGIDREVWAFYFLQNYPAELIPVAEANT